MEEHSLSKPMSDARNLLWVVTGLVISIIFLFLFGVVQGKTFSNLLASVSKMSSIVSIIQLVTIISAILYALLWAHNGLLEINAVEEWLNPPNYVAGRRFLFILGSILIGIFISLVIVVTTTFEIFALAILFYCVLDIILWYARLEELKTIISSSNEALVEKRSELEALDFACEEGERGMEHPEVRIINMQSKANAAFHEYYLERRHYSRVMLQAGATTFALVFFLNKELIILSLNDGIITEQHILFFSYLCVWLSFVVAEGTVYLWRRDLHSSLNSIRTEMYQLRKESMNRVVLAPSGTMT